MRRDELIVEIETDKVVMEVVAPVDGTTTEPAELELQLEPAKLDSGELRLGLAGRFQGLPVEALMWDGIRATLGVVDLLTSGSWS